MKKCTECNQEFLESEFSKKKTGKNGLHSKCKSCVKIKRKKYSVAIKNGHQKYYQKHKEYFALKGKASYHRHKQEIAKRRKRKRILLDDRAIRAQRQRKWRERNKEKCVLYVKKYIEKNKEKHSAHGKVYRAIKKGILIRSNRCEKCEKDGKTEAHHEDYSKPFQVQWLCRKCHAEKLDRIKVIT